MAESAKEFFKEFRGKKCSKSYFRAKRYIVTTELISPVLTRFCRKSPSFGKSYRTRNILTRFCRKSPSFGKSYRIRNSLTRFCKKSPTFGKSYRTRNILTRFCRKSPSFGKSCRFDREAFDSVEPLHGYDYIIEGNKIHYARS